MPGMIIAARILFCGLMLAMQFAPNGLFAKNITDADIRKHIAVLASDTFEGRAPGTNGEALTLKYITEIWEKAGLKPAARDGLWLDPVALLQRAPDNAKYQFMAKGRTLKFVGDDFVLIGNQASIQRENVPLLFVGHGVDASGKISPDISGKVALMLSAEPDHGPADMRSVRARRDALLDAGALAVFVVADDPANWSAMRRQILSRPIVRDRAEQQPHIEGSMSSEFAVAFITSAGLDWDKLRFRAKSREFAAENLGVSVDFDVKTDIHRFFSQNVIGTIKGRKPGSGEVLFLGLCYHLGFCQPPEASDRICNGAVDNASGIAMLSEIAGALAKTKPDRDIYFLATTAEESGLLGAYAFAENPPFPINEIVAAFNLDTGAIAPKGKAVAIVGRGYTALDPLIDAVSRKSRRKVDASLQVNDFVTRQDGWALSKSGIPAVMVGGNFSDNDRVQKFLGSDYHGPKDELTPGLDLSGAVEDAQLHVALGRFFASTSSFKGNKSGR